MTDGPAKVHSGPEVMARFRAAATRAGTERHVVVYSKILERNPGNPLLWCPTPWYIKDMSHTDTNQGTPFPTATADVTFCPDGGEFQVNLVDPATGATFPLDRVGSKAEATDAAQAMLEVARGAARKDLSHLPADWFESVWDAAKGEARMASMRAWAAEG